MAYNQIEQNYLNLLADSALPPPEPVEPSLEGLQLAAGPSATRTDAPQGYGSIRAVEPTTFEKALQAAGIGLEQAGRFLDGLGQVEVPGLGNVSLADFMPFVGSAKPGTRSVMGEPDWQGTPKVLQAPAAGQPIVTGKGQAMQLSPDAKLAAMDVAFNAKPTAALVGKTAKALAPTAANMMESGLRKSGLIMDVVPPGPSSPVILLKIGERELNIPAQQAATLQRAIKNLMPEEQAKFRSDTASKFVSILKELPTKEEFGAAAVAGKAKKGWYQGSTEAILQVFGPDSSRFAALLSATSPQTSVESNLFNALQVWKNWTAAGRPTDRESIVRVMGESVQGNKGEESVLDAWINNSVRALSAEDPSSVVLSGPKVNSFMLNLQGNVNEVTNDAWMAAFSYVDQNLFSGKLTKSGDPGKGPGYLAMNARVRETAAHLTKLTGETWTPAEVQETIWSWAKTLYETAGAKGEKRSAVQLIRDNAITDELIAATPDFRTLFYDDRFAPILKQAGYSEQLAQLRAATGTADGTAGTKVAGASGKAGAIDSDSQRKYLERNAKRLDKLRADREKEAASKAKAKVQNAIGGVE